MFCLVYWAKFVVHGSATAGTGRANSLEIEGLFWLVQARPCQASGHVRLIFFIFSHRVGQVPTKQIEITQK